MRRDDAAEHIRVSTRSAQIVSQIRDEKGYDDKGYADFRVELSSDFRRALMGRDLRNIGPRQQVVDD